MTFKQIVSSYLNKSTSKIRVTSNYTPCPDQVFGILRNNIVAERRLDGDDFSKCSKSAIILVLESPHTEEFRGNKVEPAKGMTGDNIKDFLVTFDGLPQDNRYIILINAIRYQCSLGVKTEIFRDDIFEAVWNDFGKGCFINRFKTIYQDGDYVINACTKGKGTKQLRCLVEDAIKQVIQRDSDLHTFHPSCWHNLEHEERKWLWNKNKECEISSRVYPTVSRVRKSNNP